MADYDIRKPLIDSGVNHMRVVYGGPMSAFEHP